MAKNKRKKQQTHSARPTTTPTALAAELREQARQIRDAGDSVPGAMWGKVQQLLLKSPIDNSRVGKVIMGRDMAILEQMIISIETGVPLDELDSQSPPSNSDAVEVSSDLKRKAMQAFRKRLKLTKLDHESRLGVGPMTGGKEAAIDAILPPREFDSEVWEALVADGKLRKTGGGFLAVTVT